MPRCLLAEDYDRTRYEVETPLTSLIDYQEIRAELCIPDYVEQKNFLLERGIVTIWAALKAGLLPQADSVEGLRIKNDPIPVLLFGGGAVKMLSPKANDPSSPLYRHIDDIDLITSKKRGQDLCKLLLALGNLCGTRYYHFITRTDRQFNAMRAGKRYRVRTIGKIHSEDTLEPGTLDVFTDGIDLRHKVDVRMALEDPKRHMYTVGAENLILTKCQYIFDVSKKFEEELTGQGLGYRILNYPSYQNDKILIGIEEKDMKDICTLLTDHEVGGGGPRSLNVTVIRKVLERDKKLALTVRLNLESLQRNETYLRRLGLSSTEIEVIMAGANALLESMPTVDKNWSRPWWNVDVETPEIFGKAENT